MCKFLEMVEPLILLQIFKKENTKVEIEKAERYGSFVGSKNDDFRFKEIVEIIKLIKK